MSKIRFQFYPKSMPLPDVLKNIPVCFEKAVAQKGNAQIGPDELLDTVRPDLVNKGYTVKSKAKKITFKAKKITIPILFGENNTSIKSFNVDALSNDGKIIIDVEAGRGWLNYEFLNNIIEACLIQNVEYLVIAVLQDYTTKTIKSNDYVKAKEYLDALYASNRLTLPLKGVLLIGY